MPDTHTAADDVREIAAATRDLASLVATLGAGTARVEERLTALERAVANVAVKLDPAFVFFETRNREHAEADAEVAEAGKRKTATLDEWLAWLTPRRAVSIILGLGALCGLGGPLTGMAGRAQLVADAVRQVLDSPLPEEDIDVVGSDVPSPEDGSTQ